MSAKLISVIGPPAAGKTTLAEHLAAELPAQMIRESYSENPFLVDSYVGCDDARLPGQLYFLFSRLKQLSKAHWTSEGLFVSDYGFCQDRIFAKLRLGEDDFRTYQRVAHRTAPLVHQPELMICLDASVETLLARITERGRDYETALTGELLASFRRQYDTIPAWADCPVVTVDTEVVDVRDPHETEKLISAIRTKL